LVIDDVRARTIRLPLERPIRTSDLVIEAREYALIEVAVSSGHVGRSFGFTRDGPVQEVVERSLAPLVIGEDARLVEACWHRMYAGTRYLGRRGLLMRAISAVDIALWDVKAQAVGVPLWVLLGGARTEVPAYVAGGYYGADEGLDDIEREFRSYRAAGYRGAKINLGGLPLEKDLERVAAARRGLGPEAELAVDFNGALGSARTALAWADALAPYRIAQLEEPFLMDDAASWRGFATRSPIPVAMGEDESGRWAFADLVAHGAMDVVRHDATLVGGISEWIKIAGLALAHNLRLFPHWFPEIHVHLAAAYPACLGVELVAPERGIMEVHRIVRNPVSAVDGRVAAPSAPGLGIDWNWKVIDACTV
jgi:D-arabinonate dehydratase